MESNSNALFASHEELGSNVHGLGPRIQACETTVGGAPDCRSDGPTIDNHAMNTPSRITVTLWLVGCTGAHKRQTDKEKVKPGGWFHVLSQILNCPSSGQSRLLWLQSQYLIIQWTAKTRTGKGPLIHLQVPNCRLDYDAQIRRGHVMEVTGTQILHIKIRYLIRCIAYFEVLMHHRD